MTKYGHLIDFTALLAYLGLLGFIALS